MSTNSETNNSKRASVIAIGGSLGGLSALQGILSAIPESFVLPIVIVLHRATDSADELISMVHRCSNLPVCEPEDKQPIEEGHVFLAPPNYHLLVDRDAFHLSIDEPILSARPSIDVLFDTVAHSYGSEALAIVLSGASRDGTEGAARVSSRGGVVIVQDPNTAESPIMPQAALSAVPDALVTSPESIGQLICELVGLPEENRR